MLLSIAEKVYGNSFNCNQFCLDSTPTTKVRILGTRSVMSNFVFKSSHLKVCSSIQLFIGAMSRRAENVGGGVSMQCSVPQSIRGEQGGTMVEGASRLAPACSLLRSRLTQPLRKSVLLNFSVAESAYSVVKSTPATIVKLLPPRSPSFPPDRAR